MDNLNINSFDFNRLINHCTILIASSFNGKSVLIKDILYKLKDQIPIGILFSPTAN
jgi:hypothetical protein